MKKFLYITAFLILGTAFNTKANPTDPTHHSFLKPQYKGVFTENNLGDFVAILKKAAQGDKTYFQDPYIDERLAAHFEAVLGDQYPGNPIAVIDGMKWLRAEDFTGNLQMGMITLDYKSTDWDPNWRPRKGEMLGIYGDIPLISSYCGNLTKGRFIAPQQPAVNTVPNQPTVTAKTQNPPMYNNQQVTIVQPSGDISWEKGKNIYDQGKTETQLQTYQDMMMFKDLTSSNGGGNTTSTIGATNVVYTPAPQQGGGGYYPEKPRFIETFGGQVTAGVIGTAGGNILADWIEGKLGRRNNSQFIIRNQGGYVQQQYNTTPLNPYGSQPIIVPKTRRFNESQLNGQIVSGYGNANNGYTNTPLFTN